MKKLQQQTALTTTIVVLWFLFGSKDVGWHAQISLGK